MQSSYLCALENERDYRLRQIAHMSGEYHRREDRVPHKKEQDSSEHCDNRAGWSRPGRSPYQERQRSAYGVNDSMEQANPRTSNKVSFPSFKNKPLITVLPCNIV